jgi:hypothetical protein
MSQSNYKKKPTADLPSPGYVGLYFSQTLGVPAIIDENGTITPFAPSPTYVHAQVSSSASWTVNHNLGFYPDVAVFSPGNMIVEAEVFHTSINQTIISFVGPQSGSARFS